MSTRITVSHGMCSQAGSKLLPIQTLTWSGKLPCLPCPLYGEFLPEKAINKVLLETMANTVISSQPDNKCPRSPK